jgi:hypothetical protein
VRTILDATIARCRLGILVVSVLVAALVQTGRAAAMSSRLSEAQTESEEDQPSEDVNDPTAMLTQIRLFEFYTPENFRSQAQTNVALIQPIIPVARLSLLPIEQIIRPTVKLSTTATGPGANNRAVGVQYPPEANAPGQWSAERIPTLSPKEGTSIVLSGPRRVAEHPMRARILNNPTENAHHRRLRGGEGRI